MKQIEEIKKLKRVKSVIIEQLDMNVIPTIKIDFNIKGDYGDEYKVLKELLNEITDRYYWSINSIVV